MSIQNICIKYNCSKNTLYSRCHAYFNDTPLNIAGKNKKEKQYVSEERKQEISKERRERWLGENNPLFKQFPDKKQLEYMLANDYSADDIAKQFDMSKPTLYKKIKQMYGIKMKELRKYVKQ